MSDWLAANHGRSGYDLVVAHTHAHGDHVAGDGRFADRPDTTVGRAARWRRSGSSSASRTGLARWSALTWAVGCWRSPGFPGIIAASIVIYDPWSGFLLTGRHVLPGRLYAFDYPEFIASMDRLVDFAAARPVTHVMGCHVEMSHAAGRDYPIGSRYQPDERPDPDDRRRSSPPLGMPRGRRGPAGRARLRRLHHLQRAMPGSDHPPANSRQLAPPGPPRDRRSLVRRRRRVGHRPTAAGRATFCCCRPVATVTWPSLMGRGSYLPDLSGIWAAGNRVVPRAWRPGQLMPRPGGARSPARPAPAPCGRADQVTPVTGSPGGTGPGRLTQWRRAGPCWLDDGFVGLPGGAAGLIVETYCGDFSLWGYFSVLCAKKYPRSEKSPRKNRSLQPIWLTLADLANA